MYRERRVPADPVRSTPETITAIADLIVAALPSVYGQEVHEALAAIHAPMRFLVGTETTAATPLTLLASSLICDIFTVHGEDALAADQPTVPLGAAHAADWLLFVPVPDGAPYGAEDLGAAGRHVQPGPAPEALRKAAEDGHDGATLVDAEALRKATKQ